MTHRRAVPWLLLALAFALGLTWNLGSFPAPWVDEGQHLSAAATLTATGLYGTRNAGRVEILDPAIQVGPPVILPVAAAVAAAGVSFGAARAVMVVLALATAAMLAFVGRRLVGDRAALFTMAFVLVGLADPFTSFLYLGRQLLGEVAALGWWLAGFALCAFPGPRPRASRAIAAGLCFGLAMLTKGQLLFIGSVALAAWWLVDRAWHRQQAWWSLPVAVVVAVAIVAAWQGLQLLVVGPEAYAHHSTVLSEGLWLQVLAFDATFARRALGVLWRSGFALWGTASLAYALWKSAPRTPAASAHAGLAVLALVAIGWFAAGSIGWARYGFYGLNLPFVWLGGLCAALWNRAVAHSPATAAAATPVRLPRLAAVALLGVLVASVGAGGRAWWLGIVTPPETGFAAMRQFLVDEVPADAVVETWEWELMAVAPQPFSHPGLDVMYAATAVVQGGAARDRVRYDPLWARPRYLLQGPFGGWTGLYDEVLRGPSVVEVARRGRYVLYEIGDEGAR